MLDFFTNCSDLCQLTVATTRRTMYFTMFNFHSLQYHLYADDSQLYISFKTDCFADLAQAKSSVELCVKDIDWWMTKNMLKLNQEKTELIVIKVNGLNP